MFRIEVRDTTVKEGLSKIPITVEARLRTFMTAFAVRVLGQIQINIVALFRSTGPLYQGVFAETSNIGEGGVQIQAGVRDVPYARILEEGGTIPGHIILPRTASVLAFEGPAGLVFAKRVNHPGSNFPPRPYVGLALAQLRGDFDSGIRETVGEATGYVWSSL